MPAKDPERAPPRRARCLDSQDVNKRSQPRIRGRPLHRGDVRRCRARGRRVPLSGPLPPGTAGLGRSRVGHVRARPAGEAVPPDRRRAANSSPPSWRPGGGSPPASPRSCCPHEALAAFVAVARAARARGRRRARPAPRDAHARARRARRGSGDRTRAGAQQARRCREPQTYDDDAWQKERSGHAPHSMARRAPERSEIRAPPAEGLARLHAGGDVDPGARHRRQQRDLRARRRHAASTASVRPSRSPGVDLGKDRDHSAELRVAAQHARLERSQPHVREGCGVHAERRRHGDGRRRRQRRDGVAAVGHGRDIRRARRHTHCRPDVFRRRTTPSAQT